MGRMGLGRHISEMGAIRAHLELTHPSHSPHGSYMLHWSRHRLVAGSRNDYPTAGGGSAPACFRSRLCRTPYIK